MIYISIMVQRRTDSVSCAFSGEVLERPKKIAYTLIPYPNIRILLKIRYFNDKAMFIESRMFKLFFQVGEKRPVKYLSTMGAPIRTSVIHM